MPIDRTNLDAMIDLIKDLSYFEMLAVQWDLHAARNYSSQQGGNDHSGPLYHTELGAAIALVSRDALAGTLPALGSASVSDAEAARTLAHTTITTAGIAAAFAKILALPSRTGRWFAAHRLRVAGASYDTSVWPPQV